MSLKQIGKVNIIAPARLHLGFLDLHGGLGRRFGGLGFCIDDIVTELCVSPASDLTARGPGAERAMACARALIEELNLQSGIHIELQQAIPEHNGLGSGTQMSMALGSAINRLFNLGLSSNELAGILHRGKRSGIGIGGFNQGGFIVDGGRGEKTDVPPVISHIPVPEQWRFILVMDTVRAGISGSEEREFFKELPPMAEDVVGKLSRLVLLQVLPALCENDCDNFGRAISVIQEAMGDYFTGAQGGHFTSLDVEKTVRLLEQAGATGAGQSSWGPTGFAIFPTETAAHQAMRATKERLAGKSNITFRLCKARNEPADIHDVALNKLKQY